MFLHCAFIFTLLLMSQVPKALVDIVAILYRLNANRKLVYPTNIRIKIQNFFKLSAVLETCCKSIPMHIREVNSTFVGSRSLWF